MLELKVRQQSCCTGAKYQSKNIEAGNQIVD